MSTWTCASFSMSIWDSQLEWRTKKRQMKETQKLLTQWTATSNYFSRKEFGYLQLLRLSRHVYSIEGTVWCLNSMTQQSQPFKTSLMMKFRNFSQSWQELFASLKITVEEWTFLELWKINKLIFQLTSISTSSLMPVWELVSMRRSVRFLNLPRSMICH